MARLSQRGERAVTELIDRYELHARFAGPVPIRQVARDEGWILRWSDQLHRIFGLAIVVDDVRVMTINSRVAEPFQRMAIAHEMGHLLNGDEGDVHLCAMTGAGFTDWLRGRQERQATLAAARLLVPDWVLNDGGTLGEIAVRCRVPVELVQLRAGR